MFHRPAPSDANAALDPEQGSPVMHRSIASGKDLPPPPPASQVKNIWKTAVTRIRARDGKRSSNEKSRGLPDSGFLPSEGESDVDCDVIEIWFAGCHSDVGGGAVIDSVKECLGDISLRWMIREVVLSQVGVLFDPEALLRANLDISTISRVVVDPTSGIPSTTLGQKRMEDFITSVPSKSQPPADSGIDEDYKQPIHDSLKQTPLWWILEVLPMRYAWQDSDCQWHRKWG